jgi:hypothetical protein
LSNSSSAHLSSVRPTYRPTVLRQLFRDRVWSATPSLIAHDDADLTVLWLPPGLTYAIGDALFGEWAYRLRVMRRGQIRLLRRGEPFSVFLFFNHDATFRGWYVNIERAQRRTQLGFDYEDDLLDVWRPVAGEAELLDEDELEEAVARGFVSKERAEEIRSNAESVLADPPWPTGWEDWKPEAGWQLPELPPGWEEV